MIDNAQSHAVVYSRRGCHLCELLLEDVEPILRGRASLEVRDVDTRQDWLERYGLRVPVLMLDGDEICHFQLDRDALLAALI
jgi:hypothetical protein